MKYVLPAAVAIGIGLVVLASYLVPNPLLFSIRLALTDWAAILAALAVLIGIFNLLLVNSRRIQSGGKGWVYNLVTILALFFTLAIGVYESFGQSSSALYRSDTITMVLYRGVIVAALATLTGLIAIFLIISAARLPRSKPGIWAALFLGAALVALVGWLPFQFAAPLNSFRQWVLTVPATAGARGIIIGVALGTLVIGIRVLTGVERPYKD